MTDATLFPVAKPVIPWPGGKRRLAARLICLMPEHSCYVEPFAGGAALLFAREPAKVEVINDINGDLVCMYRVVQHHLEELVRQFKWALASRKMFEWAQMQRPETLTDVQRAARFLFLQRSSFAGKVSSRSYGTATTATPRINLLRIEEELSAAHLRLAEVFIEHLPWLDCIKRYDRSHTLHYCDPPYWDTEGYGVSFGLEQYEALSEVMRVAKGKVMLSINDHPEMRRVFKGFRSEQIPITYTMGNGTAGKGAKRMELVVMSW